MARELFLCSSSAVLLALSFPNLNFWISAWFGFVPLFFALEGKSKGKAFLFSYFTGIIFWTWVIYWLVHVTLPGTIFFILYLALYFGIFGAIVSTTEGLFFIPCLWVLLEYLRSHIFTGFPWALVGYSQYLNLPVIQISDITGVWGVSFLVITVNVLIYSALRKRKKYILPVLLIAAVLVYGYFRIYQIKVNASRAPLKVSVIQGNILQELKWNPQARDFIIARQMELTEEAMKDRPDLIIWSEAALPVIWEEEPQYHSKMSSFVKTINTPLLFGTVTLRDNLYYNSALLFSKEGKILNKYDKLHLVPFGEYIPLRMLFGFLETVVPIGDFDRGREYTVFNLTGASTRLPARFSALICFEDLFPELSRNFVLRGAQFLVNITNDAWFKKSSAPYQHLCASVFRAVENRVCLVRSANTGVSGFIAPSGRIISLAADKFNKHIFIPAYATSVITVSDRRPGFYTRHGDVFAGGCFLFTLYVIILRFRKRG